MTLAAFALARGEPLAFARGLEVLQRAYGLSSDPQNLPRERSLLSVIGQLVKD